MKIIDTPEILEARNEVRKASENQDRAHSRFQKAMQGLRAAIITSSPVKVNDVIAFQDYAGRDVTGTVSSISVSPGNKEIVINARGEIQLPNYPGGRHYTNINEYTLVRKAGRRATADMGEQLRDAVVAKVLEADPKRELPQGFDSLSLTEVADVMVPSRARAIAKAKKAVIAAGTSPKDNTDKRLPKALVTRRTKATPEVALPPPLDVSALTPAEQAFVAKHERLHEAFQHVESKKAAPKARKTRTTSTGSAKNPVNAKRQAAVKSKTVKGHSALQTSKAHPYSRPMNVNKKGKFSKGVSND